MKCTQGKEIQVLKSAAGYYIGTLDEGIPNCRLSVDYYKKLEDAAKALDNMSFIDRMAEENKFCNGYKGCLSKK